MVLLLSQRVAFSMLSQGHNRIGSLADNTTRFIEDHVADFIISNGGWVSPVAVSITSLLPYIITLCHYYPTSLVSLFLINVTIF